MSLQTSKVRRSSAGGNRDEDGAALAIVIIIVAILAVVAMTALAFSSSEARIAGRDLQRSQTFYAAVAGLEKMTSDFSDIFRQRMNPTPLDLTLVAANSPPALAAEGFSFSQTIQEDTERLNELRSIQGLPGNVYPRVNIPNGPYAGLYASILPYKMSSTAIMDATGTEVELEREFNNYLVPLFQFGMYSNEDLEFAPGPMMTFNGRIHSNKNIYALRNIQFLNRMTMAGEFIRDAKSSGAANTSSGNNNVWIEVAGVNVQSTKGSMQAGSGTVGGPYISGSSPGDRGYYPGSPLGIPNTSWETESVKPANGTVNRFGGQLLTHTTSASELRTPLELSGNSPAELIKRKLPTDDQILSESRFHTGSQVRILIDDESAGTGTANEAGIPAGKGVLLSSFDPIPLDNGSALRRVSDAGAYLDGSSIRQIESISPYVESDAKTVRGIKGAPVTSPNYIPPGSGMTGRILIEIVKDDGTVYDVTQEILSMGMTVGEPNGIFYLQRPIWAAFVQGSRDRDGNGFDLVNMTKDSQRRFADGEIIATPVFDPDTGYMSMTLSTADEDGGTVKRNPGVSGYDSIYPINVYNVREGWYQSSLDVNDIYERGMMTVIDVNMRNLARWFDGVYDSNLLAGTNAVSSNIEDAEGYVVYISDRRGDKVKTEYLADATSHLMTNGLVDNEDIYGPNNILDAGEDVIDFGWDATATSKKGTLQRDLTELPTTGLVWGLPTSPTAGDRLTRAMTVMQWNNPSNYFRRSVRLFNGEVLSISGASGKLSPTKGITIAAENPVYIWGNYNTQGISSIPPGRSTLNNGGYLGPQIPASIATDAFFPLSKTWFDGLTAMRPEGSADPVNRIGTEYRMADENLPGIPQGTAVRAGIIAGTTLSALTASPGRNAAGSRRNGGAVNYPRFLELWNFNGKVRAWSYSGSFIPLYRSTQAMAQWENSTSAIYMPPIRNWSFDETYLTPNKLPPGTPFFQYVQATGFRQKLR